MARKTMTHRMEGLVRDITLLGAPIPKVRAEVGNDGFDYASLKETKSGRNRLVEHFADQRRDARQASLEEWGKLNPRLDAEYDGMLDRIISNAVNDVVPVRADGEEAQMCFHAHSHQYALMKRGEGFQIRSNQLPVAVNNGEVDFTRYSYDSTGLVAVVTHLSPMEVSMAAGVEWFRDLDVETANKLLGGYFRDVMSEQAKRLEAKYGVNVTGVLLSMFKEDVYTNRPEKGAKVNVVVCVGEHMLPQAVHLATEDNRLIQNFPRVAVAASYLTSDRG